MEPMWEILYLFLFVYVFFYYVFAFFLFLASCGRSLSSSSETHVSELHGRPWLQDRRPDATFCSILEIQIYQPANTNSMQIM